ncbi:Hypothetical predicted protein, partial [Pelobates cultripes]
MTLKDNCDYKHKGPWRLNESLLTDQLFTTQIEKAIMEFFTLNDTGDATARTIWQGHKAVIRGILIRRAAHLQQTSQAQWLTWDTRVADLKNKINPTAAMQKNINEIANKIKICMIQRVGFNLCKLKATYYT